MASASTKFCRTEGLKDERRLSDTIFFNAAAVRASGAAVVGEQAVVNRSLRTMVRISRRRCIPREYPQALTRLEVTRIRCLLVGQPDSRSMYRPLLMFAGYSFHPRRWRCSAWRQSLDAPATLIHFHALAGAESIATGPRYK